MADWVSTLEAANLLDVHPRSIYRYTKRGLIRVKYEKRKLFISREDLVVLQVGRQDTLTSPYTKDTINKLILEVQQLKTQMATVLRLLNVNYVPLGFTDPEYRAFYQTADQLSTEGWSPHVEDQWADYFVRLKVEDFDSLERVTGDLHPWRPFLRLAVGMHLRPWNTRLRDLLGSGRSNIHQVASMWCVMKDRSQKEFSMLVERDATPPRKLIRRISKEQDS